MRLKRLIAGRWQILSPITGTDDLSAAEAFIDKVNDSYSTNVAGLLALMEQHSTDGPQSFNSKQCHYIDPNKEIYEYRRGKLRLFWFADEDRVVICTHGILKKTQKTPKREAETAKRIRKRYLEAKAAKRIKIEE